MVLIQLSQHQGSPGTCASGSWHTHSLPVCQRAHGAVTELLPRDLTPPLHHFPLLLCVAFPAAVLPTASRESHRWGWGKEETLCPLLRAGISQAALSPQPRWHTAVVCSARGTLLRHLCPGREEELRVIATTALTPATAAVGSRNRRATGSCSAGEAPPALAGTGTALRTLQAFWKPLVGTHTGQPVSDLHNWCHYTAPRVPTATLPSRAQPLPRALAQNAASTFLDSCHFPPLLSQGLNPSQDQLLSACTRRHQPTWAGGSGKRWQLPSSWQGWI